MKILKFPLPHNHTGIAEIQGDEIILYIEKPGTIFFGLIDWPTRCTPFEIFKMSDSEDNLPREHVDIIHGRIFRGAMYYKNIETFNPVAELERMFATYWENKQRQDAWNKRMENFTKNI